MTSKDFKKLYDMYEGYAKRYKKEYEEVFNMLTRSTNLCNNECEFNVMSQFKTQRGTQMSDTSYHSNNHFGFNSSNINNMSFTSTSSKSNRKQTENKHKDSKMNDPDNDTNAQVHKSQLGNHQFQKPVRKKANYNSDGPVNQPKVTVPKKNGRKNKSAVDSSHENIPDSTVSDSVQSEPNPKPQNNTKRHKDKPKSEQENPKTDRGENQSKHNNSDMTDNT